MNGQRDRYGAPANADGRELAGAVRVARALADGRAHSRASLAVRTGLSGAELSVALSSLGLTAREETPETLRLRSALSLLDEARIRAACTVTPLGIEVYDLIDSTNARLLAADPGEGGALRVLLAEFQSQGRGRRGRRWQAPYGGGLCLSLCYLHRGELEALACTALVAGIAVQGALSRLGIAGVRLKWPNDLFVGEAKLGGILVESMTDVRRSGGARGRPALRMVVGVGLNVDLSNAGDPAGATEYPVTDLETVAPGWTVDRNLLAGALIDALAAELAEFARHGFAPFHPRWAAVDHLAGREVASGHGDACVHGVAEGVDETGALLVRRADGLQSRLVSAAASVRAVGPAE